MIHKDDIRKKKEWNKMFSTFNGQHYKPRKEKKCEKAIKLAQEQILNRWKQAIYYSWKGKNTLDEQVMQNHFNEVEAKI